MAIKVTSQSELDRLPLDTKGIIQIDFGDKNNPARINNTFLSPIVVLGDSYVLAEANDNHIVAQNRCTVEAYNSTTIDAQNMSTIIAMDSAQVNAMNHSKVIAKDESVVFGKGNSSIIARDNSAVILSEKSHVELHDTAQILTDSRNDAMEKVTPEPERGF